MANNGVDQFVNSMMAEYAEPMFYRGTKCHCELDFLEARAKLALKQSRGLNVSPRLIMGLCEAVGNELWPNKDTYMKEVSDENY